MKKLVIKIGSNILADSKEGLNIKRISSLVREISSIHDSDYDIAIVSSGAIAAGMKKLGLKKRPIDIKLKQAAAAVGQSSLIWAYEKCFNEFNKKVAQILLTGEDFSDRKRYINSKNTIYTLFSYKIIPIINENDTVAIDEIKFGDNDNLAALVSILIEADRLIILSDVEGLYTADPKYDHSAKLINYVDEITDSIEEIAGGSSSLFGTGGMYSKLLAAKKATEYGVTVNIINGKKEGLLKSIIEGKTIGTTIKPKKEKISSRKMWIAYGCKTKGSIKIDDGAVKAILEGGKSLLPSGIVSVEGSFDIGDAVYCVNTNGEKIAKGLVNYSSIELEKIKGEKTKDIEKILGYKYSDEAIHRDNLVII